jgi:predicted phage terminase large subunit-like protein
MVFMPPRHGKSELISKYFPAWYIGTHPDNRIILTSYEADQAAGFGQKARDLLDAYNKVYGVKINAASAARNRWDIEGHRGGMVTAGVGGAITGKGANIFIIDDPVKNSEQANSVTYREKAKDWYRSTAYTRLTPDGAVILIQTRWHEDDLGGWLLSESQDEWDVLKLPALDENNNPLWGDHFTYDKLMGIKQELGEYWFSAMYQQEPQPAEGAIFNRSWIKYYDQLPYNDDWTTYTGFDLAISEKETADYTCSCTARVDPRTNDIYVIDWTREHISAPQQANQVIAMYDRWQPAVIGVETNAYQAALPQFVLQKRLIPIKNMPTFKDKVTKITSGFTMFEQGKVYLPVNHPLLAEFENEYVRFPLGTHDDLLDATNMVIELAKMGNNPFTETNKRYDYSNRKSIVNKRRR